MVQRLEGGEARRLDLCRWVIANRRLIPFILFTDKASFTRDGINNTHNSHRWSDKNPHATVERNSQHRFSVNVWCGMIDSQLTGLLCYRIVLYRVRICRLSAKRASTIIGGGSFG